MFDVTKHLSRVRDRVEAGQRAADADAAGELAAEPTVGGSDAGHEAYWVDSANINGLKYEYTPDGRYTGNCGY